MQNNFHVYIIESPSPVDLYHGRFESESLQKTLRLSNIESSFRLTVNLESFTASFYVGLKEYFQSNSLPPIIHISAHGDDNGIVLTSGEKVDWLTLKNLLVPVNQVLKGGLLLSLSACKGVSGCRMAMFDDVFPFFAIIANAGNPEWSETNIAYGTFYHLFRRGHDIKDAVEAMNRSSGNTKFQIMESTTARNAYIEVLREGQAVSTMQQNIPTSQSQSLNQILTKNFK